LILEREYEGEKGERSPETWVTCFLQQREDLGEGTRGDTRRRKRTKAED